MRFYHEHRIPQMPEFPERSDSYMEALNKAREVAGEIRDALDESGVEMVDGVRAKLVGDEQFAIKIIVDTDKGSAEELGLPTSYDNHPIIIDEYSGTNKEQ